MLFGMKTSFERCASAVVVKREERPEQPSEWPGHLDAIWHLMSMCWQPDPLDRPTAASVVKVLRHARDGSDASTPNEHSTGLPHQALLAPATEQSWTAHQHSDSHQIQEDLQAMQLTSPLIRSEEAISKPLPSFFEGALQAKSSEVLELLERQSPASVASPPLPRTASADSRPSSAITLNTQGLLPFPGHSARHIILNTQKTEVNTGDSMFQLQKLYDDSRKPQGRRSRKPSLISSPTTTVDSVSDSSAPELQSMREHYSMARVSATNRDFAEAERHYEAAARHAETAGYTQAKKLSLANASRCCADALAANTVSLKHWEKCAEQYKKAGTLYRACGEEREALAAESNAAYDLFVVAAVKGKLRAAAKHLEAAAKLDELGGNDAWAVKRRAEAQAYKINQKK